MYFRKRIFKLSTLALLTLIVTLAACAPSGGTARGDIATRPVRVVSTIGMINDAVLIIGGERVDAVGLMGPGVDPHLYNASEGDVMRLSEADLVLFNGLHLESKMGEVLERMDGLGVKAVAVAEGIPADQLLQPDIYAGNYDPHVWFEVPLWRSVVEAVRDALIAVDPGSTELYAANAAAYLLELEDLQAYVLAQVERVPPEKRVLITAHDAFKYFGRAYGFEVLGLQGISTATEAGTGDVQDLSAFIAERRIPAIFVESSVPVRNIEAVQAAVQAQGFAVTVGGELFSDAMGDAGTPEGTYVGMVRHNVDTIVEALASE